MNLINFTAFSAKVNLITFKRPSEVIAVRVIIIILSVTSKSSENYRLCELSIFVK